MMHGMVTNAMTSFHHHAENIGMLPHIVAHHEESSLDFELVKFIKHPRRHFGDRSIIKSQVNGFIFRIHPPKC